MESMREYLADYGDRMPAALTAELDKVLDALK
jgi:hypothetical protein